jgi:hypothetical protein
MAMAVIPHVKYRGKYVDFYLCPCALLLVCPGALLLLCCR